MTGVDADLVRRKLGRIRRNLDELAAVEGLSPREYAEDYLRKKAAERMLQEVVEAAVDVNLHVVRALGRDTPPDYYQSFLSAAEVGLIPGELGRSLAPSAGLRNRLVHEYDEIDDRLVLDAVAEARDHFRRFVGAVESFLTDRGF